MLSDNLSPEDLLADESFINFCKKTSQADTEKWQRYAAENNEQRLQVEAAQKLFAGLFSILAAEDLAEQESILKRKLLSAETPPVVSMAEVSEKKQRLTFFSRYKIGYAAAVLLIIAGSYFLFTQSRETKESLKSFTVPNGERKSFQLADGSLITLNAGSKISIDKDYGVSDRDVYLEGEAFFDVKHNTALPFIVHTPAMDVKAVGTAFNVKAYAGERLSEAALIRGLVEVTLNKVEGHKLLLHPNQKVRWDSRNEDSSFTEPTTAENKTENNRVKQLIQPLKTTESGDIKEVAWTANKLIFDDETFGDIAAVFERWYGVKINFTDEDVRDIRFTGTFQKEELRTVLAFWKESKKFNYTITPGNPTVITISK
jgi:transmembrane sensor